MENKTITELIAEMRKHEGYPITVTAGELGEIGLDWAWWEDAEGNHLNPEKIEVQSYETIDFDYPHNPSYNYIDIVVWFDGVEMDSGIDSGRCRWDDGKNTDGFVKEWFSC